MKKIKTKKGFSLVELLVVMVIMVIMTSVLVARRPSDTSTREIDAAQQLIISQLRALQNESISGKKIGSNAVRYFYFGSSVATSYYTKYTDSADTQMGPQVTNPLKNVSLNINNNPIRFVSPWGNISAGAGALTSATIIISSTKNATLKKCVCVKSGGVIENCTCP